MEQSFVTKLSPQLTEFIFSIRPSTTGAWDSFIWTQQKTGIYSAKSGYYSAQIEKIQSTTTFLKSQNWNWQKYVWSPKLLPKVKMFIWRCALNNLPTRENLRKRGLQNIPYAHGVEPRKLWNTYSSTANQPKQFGIYALGLLR